MNTELYQDPHAPIDDRVADLLSRLTVEEKAGQLTQYFYLGGVQMPDDFDIQTLPPEHRVFLEQAARVEQALDDGVAGSVLFIRDAQVANRVQRRAIEHSRFGIPLLFGFDVIHGLRTIFPVPIGLTATWNPELLEQVQTVAAREARAVGIHWAFAPMIDISRDPRWGRMSEGIGEDPVLGAAVAAAQVRGFQGDLGAGRILAGVKHYAGYGAPRGGRDYEEAEISDSELFNIYLPPFRAAVEAGAATVMSAYMDLNGVPASANRWLLTEVLRDQFGFTGFVVSDANAVRSLETQHFARDQTDAAARALNAGLDMEMSMSEPAYALLPVALAAGRIDEDTLDDAVRRVLEAKFRLGLFETPFVDEDTVTATLEDPAHRDLAQTAAEQAMVLLKNDQATLPLRADELSSVAVIGQLSTSKRDMLGPWIFESEISDTVTILDGLRARLGDHVSIEHAPGVGIRERLFATPFDADPSVESTPADYDHQAETDRAVALAAEADVAIVVVGQRQNQAGEKASTATLDLPGAQLQQLQRVVATGTPVVLVVVTARPVDLQWADEHVAAIVQAWYPGSRGGDAVASLLFGDISPAGRLPFTWPRHVGQVPMVYSHFRSFDPNGQDSRYFNEPSTPLYPFGYGLSYASFEYANLRLEDAAIPVGRATTATVDVRNTSVRDADEVVQLYIHQRYGTATRPVRELKGFQRVTVAAGQTRTVTFPLGAEQLRYWSTAGGYVQDATTIDVWAGGSSTADLHTVLAVQR